MLRLYCVFCCLKIGLDIDFSVFSKLEARIYLINISSIYLHVLYTDIRTHEINIAEQIS